MSTPPREEESEKKEGVIRVETRQQVRSLDEIIKGICLTKRMEKPLSML